MTITSHILPENTIKIGKECILSNSLHLTALTGNTSELSNNKKISQKSVF